MSSARRRRSLPVRLALVPLGVLLAATALPAVGQDANPLAGTPGFEEYGFQGEGPARVRDVDARTGAVQPSAAARQIAERLGADDPRWNDFGTPRVLFDRDGALTGPREGAAVDVARSFVADNAALFRLDAARVAALEVSRNVPLYDAPDLDRVYRQKVAPANPDVASVVTFRQRIGGLETAEGGVLTVGVAADGSVVWVSSTVTGDDVLRGEQRVDAPAAVRAAAADVGLDLGRLRPADAGPLGGLAFASSVAPDLQRARPVAVPTATDGVRRAWAVTLLDTRIDKYGNPNAFVLTVDAESGAVLTRSNRVDSAAAGAGPATVTLPAMQAAPSGGSFSGTTDQAGKCGVPAEFEVPAGTGQITVSVASPENPNTDTVLADLVAQILYQGQVVASGDSLGNPEAATYAPPPTTLPGTYAARACNFSPADPPFAYSGVYALTPVGTGAATGENGAVQLPAWRVFPANPPFVAGLDPATTASQDTRVLWCWDKDTDGSCAEEQRNSASRVPWDVNAPSTPSFTTDGNNASTAISQVSYLTPDTAANRPVSPTRNYSYPWKNAWFEGSCNPTQFGAADPTGGPNDESASTANLFAQHNRMHDWSYYLGFTEVNSNMQKSNFGNTGPERENDPELGSSQAGRQTFNGRDNANQVTLGDGTPGVTNQYLWQPLAGAFYAPCVDGAYDQAVVAHEYGHAISNRMIGGDEGPTGGTGATQGQSESWSDLQFAAYFTEFGISAGPGVNPYVLGPYVTGDPQAGIRNYAMNNSPLNYSDLDYDGNGLASPHANGEIWSATNFDILRSLNAKYDAAFPSTDKALQMSCAKGGLAAQACPGNRRWSQIMYDSFLLQPSGPTMVDSRDGMLAADVLRFGGANQRELWDAFAKRGLGLTASSKDAADTEAVAGWTSPLRRDAARVTFTAPPGVKDMEVFVGDYEARVTPVADTLPSTPVDNVEDFAPGEYTFLARAPGFGGVRFTRTFGASATTTVQVPLERRNLASRASGATITGDGVNLEALIDDTEETNWASLTSDGTASAGKGEGAQVEGRKVTVDLAGSAPVRVDTVQVSAMLRGASTATGEPDPAAQSRFSALRSFDVLTCDATRADCSKDSSFTRVFSSADDAFPGRRPRPRVVDLTLRPFAVTPSDATHVRLVARDNQCTGGPLYQGEANPDADPLFNPDCDTEASSPDRQVLAPPFDQVRAAELQVFGPTAAPSSLKAEARTITQACPPDQVPQNARKDYQGNTHAAAIDCVIWYEIAQGTSDTKYEPLLPVSRGQMASFIARLVEKSGGSFPSSSQDQFSDDNGTTHEANINKLAAAGIVSGKADGSYDPRGLVTREQMAKFLVKAYEYRSGRTLTAKGDYFSDDEASVFEDFINASATAGFTAGRDGGYQPRANVQRDAMASFLTRVLDLLVAEGTATAKSDQGGGLPAIG